VSDMIGVYGGTFDPIHFGHLRPVLDIVESLRINQCHIVPCSVPHHRALPIANSTQRLEMITAAIQDEPRFYLDTRELNRTGISYTIDTLESICLEKNSDSPVCLILGSDAFMKFDKWHRWQDIVKLCHLVVSHRPGWDMEKDLDSNKLTTELTSFVRECGIKDKVELQKYRAGKVIFQSVTQLEISSTNIRALLEKNKSIRYFLPAAVIKIIKQQNENVRLLERHEENKPSAPEVQQQPIVVAQQNSNVLWFRVFLVAVIIAFVMLIAGVWAFPDDTRRYLDVWREWLLGQ